MKNSKISATKAKENEMLIKALGENRIELSSSVANFEQSLSTPFTALDSHVHTLNITQYGSTVYIGIAIGVPAFYPYIRIIRLLVTSQWRTRQK